MEFPLRRTRTSTTRTVFGDTPHDIGMDLLGSPSLVLCVASSPFHDMGTNNLVGYGLCYGYRRGAISTPLSTVYTHVGHSQSLFWTDGTRLGRTGRVRHGWRYHSVFASTHTLASDRLEKEQESKEAAKTLGSRLAHSNLYD